MGLQSFLRKIVREGSLVVRTPGGEALRVGDGCGPPVQVAITSRLWMARIAARPSLAMGEAYMDGGLVLERGTIWDLCDIIGRNAKYRPLRRAGWLARLWRD